MFYSYKLEQLLRVSLTENVTVYSCRLEQLLRVSLTKNENLCTEIHSNEEYSLTWWRSVTKGTCKADPTSHVLSGEVTLTYDELFCENEMKARICFSIERKCTRPFLVQGCASLERPFLLNVVEPSSERKREAHCSKSRERERVTIWRNKRETAPRLPHEPDRAAKTEAHLNRTRARAP